MKQSSFDSQVCTVLEKVPKRLSFAAALLALSVFLNSAVGHGDTREGFAITTSLVWYIAIGFNISLLVAGLFSLAKALLSTWEAWTEANTFVDRVWRIAVHGPTSAGMVAEDLGKADKHGVYVRKTWTGARLFLRLSRGSMSGVSGAKIWQWSLDKQTWLPTTKIGCLWNVQQSVSRTADEIFLRRLEVESAFREQQPFPNPAVQPPAIEIGAISPQEHARLVQLAPRNFLCPISLELMTEPVVCPSGVTYDRKSVTQWIQENHSDPATNAGMRTDNLYPNVVLRDMIQEWLMDNKFGISNP